MRSFVQSIAIFVPLLLCGCTAGSLSEVEQQSLATAATAAPKLQPGDKISVRCHLLRDGSPGCLLGFVTPMHGDAARGNGVEHQWD